MEKSALNPSRLPGNSSFQNIIEPYNEAFGKLNAFLADQVSEFEPEVQPLVEYCFKHSGKKLRPLVVFSMGMDAEGQIQAGVIKAAAIVELVHLATLVHDDILDEADMRHRSETVVSRYGPHVAVLLGDALFAHALHLAAQFPGVEVCRAVSLATRQVCSGEIAQTFSRGGGSPDLEGYFRMIDLKTAELFNVSAYLGAHLAAFDPRQIQAARAYARHLGIAYQIYDDAADIFAEESVAGKTLGTDLATGKKTLPILIWLEESGSSDRQAQLEGYLASSDGITKLRNLLMETGILAKCGKVFHDQIGLAREAMLDIPDETRRKRLGQLAYFVSTAWNKFNIQ